MYRQASCKTTQNESAVFCLGVCEDLTEDDDSPDVQVGWDCVRQAREALRAQ
jgi:hypothetical protein